MEDVALQIFHVSMLACWIGLCDEVPPFTSNGLRGTNIYMTLVYPVVYFAGFSEPDNTFNHIHRSWPLRTNIDKTNSCHSLCS